MGILRLIAIAALIWVGVVLYRRYKAGQGRRNAITAYRGRMVKCEHCGVFLPESEATPGAAGRYLCPTHRTHGDRD